MRLSATNLLFSVWCSTIVLCVLEQTFFWVCVKAGGTRGNQNLLPPGYLQLLQILGDYLRLLQIWLPLVPPVTPAITHTLFFCCFLLIVSHRNYHLGCVFPFHNLAHIYMFIIFSTCLKDRKTKCFYFF